MPGLMVDVILQDIKKVESEALIVGFFEDVRPLKGLAGQLDWLLCGALSSLLIENKLRGALGDVALLTARGRFPRRRFSWSAMARSTIFHLSAAKRCADGCDRRLGSGVTHAAISTSSRRTAPWMLVFQLCGKDYQKGPGSVI
jgi:hypothetical protein